LRIKKPELFFYIYYPLILYWFVPKKNIIHKNKAARLKSSLSKLLKSGKKKEVKSSASSPKTPLKRKIKKKSS